MDNYHPMSILPAIAKMFEKLLSSSHNAVFRRVILHNTARQQYEK